MPAPIAAVAAQSLKGAFVRFDLTIGCPEDRGLSIKNYRPQFTKFTVKTSLAGMVLQPCIPKNLKCGRQLLWRSTVRAGRGYNRVSIQACRPLRPRFGLPSEEFEPVAI